MSLRFKEHSRSARPKVAHCKVALVREPESNCPDNKVIYPSKRVALAHAAGAKRNDGPDLRPYKCTDCGHWHLSSNISRDTPFTINSHRGCTIIKREGLWSTPTIPGVAFLSLQDIRKALNGYLQELYGTG